MNAHEQARIDSYYHFAQGWPNVLMAQWLRFWTLGPWPIWG